MGAQFWMWLPVMVVLYAPRAVRAVTLNFVMYGWRRATAASDEELALTAGEWLEQELLRLGLTEQIRAIVTDDQRATDSFHHGAGVITLTAATNFRRDPEAWAIAAHELSHARLKLEHPALAWLTLVARGGSNLIAQIAVALLFGNHLFALPHVTAVALGVLVAALAAEAIVVLDEWTTSRRAMASLRAGGRLVPSDLARGRTTLRYGLATYLAPFLAHAAMFAAWPLAVELTAVPRVPPTEPLTGFGTVIAAVISIAIALQFVVEALVRRTGKRWKDNPLAYSIVATLGRLTLPLFVWLVWNARADLVFAWCVIAALLPCAWALLIALAVPPLIVEAFVLAPLFRPLAVEPAQHSRVWQADARRGSAYTKAGNAVFRSLPRFAGEKALLAWLLRLAVVPLLVAYWLNP